MENHLAFAKAEFLDEKSYRFTEVDDAYEHIDLISQL